MPVLLTALGVGGATVIGALIGVLFNKPSQRLNDIILSLAAGVMLAASVIGLIIPSLDYGGKYSIVVTITGIICGALCLELIDKLVPHLFKITGVNAEDLSDNGEKLSKILLFVIAIAIHNLPEGIAAGVSFGAEDISAAITVAGGIALQNIPEGMITIAPMVAAGMSRGRAFVFAMLTGMVEVAGTFIGYFAVSISGMILPFALAFAGGTMLYIISDEMIPSTHARENKRYATYSLLLGFCLMLALDYFL